MTSLIGLGTFIVSSVFHNANLFTCKFYLSQVSLYFRGVAILLSEQLESIRTTAKLQTITFQLQLIKRNKAPELKFYFTFQVTNILDKLNQA